MPSSEQMKAARGWLWDTRFESDGDAAALAALLERREREARLEALRWALTQNITLPDGLIFPDGARIAGEIKRLEREA